MGIRSKGAICVRLDNGNGDCCIDGGLCGPFDMRTGMALHNESEWGVRAKNFGRSPSTSPTHRTSR